MGLKCARRCVLRVPGKLTPTTHQPSAHNADVSTPQRPHDGPSSRSNPHQAHPKRHGGRPNARHASRTRSSQRAAATPELLARSVGLRLFTFARAAFAAPLLPRGLAARTRLLRTCGSGWPGRAVVSPSRRQPADARGPARPPRPAVCLPAIGGPRAPNSGRREYAAVAIPERIR